MGSAPLWAQLALTWVITGGFVATLVCALIAGGRDD